jgi:hypothetical protein
MKFYRLDEIPARSDDRVFKASPVGAFIWFTVFSAMAIGLLLLAIGGKKQFGTKLPPAIFMYFGAAFIGLFAWMTFRQLRASLKPANWLLRCNDTGVIIKYRSFYNSRFPGSDVQAVGLEYSEIAWARIVKERRTSPGMGETRGNMTQRLTYLELGVANAETSALEAHLQAEQMVKPQGMAVTLDYPVEVLPGGIIRMRWKTSGGYGISPPVDKAIRCLGGHIGILAADATKVDLTHRSISKPGEEDAKILALAKSGDKMGAEQLARESYGCSLTEAVAFVKKLQSGG